LSPVLSAVQWGGRLECLDELAWRERRLWPAVKSEPLDSEAGSMTYTIQSIFALEASS
jgi:hypothetical protein